MNKWGGAGLFLAMFTLACTPTSESVDNRESRPASTGSFGFTAPDSVAPGQTFEVSWTDDSGAVLYRLWAATDKNCTEKLFTIEITTPPARVTIDFGGVVYLCMAAVADDGTETMSESSGHEISVGGSVGSGSAESEVALAWSRTIGDFATDQDSAFSKTAEANLADVIYSLDTSNMTCDNGAFSSAVAIDANSGELTGTPTNTDVGTCTIKILATKGSERIEETLTLTVGDVNDLPTWGSTLSDDTVQVSTALSGLTASAIDIDSGSSIVYSLDTGDMTCDDGSWDTAIGIDSNTGVISGTPSSSDDGVCTVEVVATSGADTINQSFSIHIYPVPTAFTWTGGGADDNWSTTGNWQGGAVPTSTSDVVFSAICGLTCPATIDQNIDIQGLELHASFAGTLTQSSTMTIDIGSTGWEQAGGSFAGGDATITSDGRVTLDGGSFTSTSGMFDIKSITIGSGVVFSTASGLIFAHNNGNFTFNGSSSCSTRTFDLQADTETRFYDLNLVATTTTGGGGCGGTYQTHEATGGANIIVENELTHTGQTAGTFQLEGNLIVNSAAGIVNFGILEFIGTGTQTYAYPDGSGRTGVIKVNKASGTVQPAAGTTDFAVRAIQIDQGSFVAPTGTLYVGRPNSGSTNGYTVLSMASGTTFTHSSGTVYLDNYSGCANPTATVDLADGVTLNHVTAMGKSLSGGGGCNGTRSYLSVVDGAVTVAGDFLYKAGQLLGPWELQGDVTLEALAQTNSATFTFTGTATQTVDNTLGGEFPSGTVTINKSGGSVVLASAMSLNEAGQDLDIIAGTLDLDGNTLTVNDVFNISAGATMLQNCGTYTQGTLNNSGTIDPSC